MTRAELTEQLRQTVTSLLKLMVAKPEVVVVQTVPCGKVTVLLVQVALEDQGRIIGRGGQLARSWRILMQAVTHQHNCSIQIDLGDAGFSKR